MSNTVDIPFQLIDYMLLIAALDVCGTQALNIWGQQWVKLLGVLYDGVTNGLPGSTAEKPRLIGGVSGEGTAARTRVQLDIERIMGSGVS